MGEIFNFIGTKSFSYAIKNSSLNLENVKTKTLMKFLNLNSRAKFGIISAFKRF